MRIPAFLIGGVNSGSGKTTLALALMRAFARRGLRVAPFKCGPDYIDPFFHRQATGRASINLDTFLMGRDGVKEAFYGNLADADVAVVEGVMGLFDGIRPDSVSGSSAEIAALLDIPVILAVNARGISGSIAPLVKGFAEWRSDVKLGGVIATFTGSPNHGFLLRDALKAAELPPLLGTLRRNEKWTLPERHLGLALNRVGDVWLDSLADAAEDEIDLDALLSFVSAERPDEAEYETPGDELPRGGAREVSGDFTCGDQPVQLGRGRTENPARLSFCDAEHSTVKPVFLNEKPMARLAVARDEAFQFYYEDNFRILRSAGVELVDFSPLHDDFLPENIHGVYLGGGFPELYAEELSANRSMLDSIRDFAACGKWIYGECGGFLYLLDALTDFKGQRHPMLGLLPGEAKMNDRLNSLGYRVLKCVSGSVFKAGTVMRGHEFHYSCAVVAEGAQELFAAENTKGLPVFSASGAVRGSVCGSYVHLHFASNPEAVKQWVEAMTR